MNAYKSVLMRWMKLEPIIQSEVSQKEKHQYNINAYIWNLERWWPYMQYSKRDTDVNNRLLDSVGEGKVGMIWDNSIETWIIICEIDGQSRFHAWDRVLRAGALGWPWGMGWGGRWEGGSGLGTHVHPWLIHVNVWQIPPQYCKVINLQLIKIN